MGEHTCSKNKNRTRVENEGDKSWDICFECARENERNSERMKKAMESWGGNDD